MRINSKKQAVELIQLNIPPVDLSEALTAYINELYAANHSMASRLAKAGLVVERAP